MNKKLYVYIGRFQIPHIGHESVMNHAISKGDEVLILIGSANTSRSKKNPFSFEERKKMVEEITTKMLRDASKNININILPLNDFDNDEDWVNEVKNLVPKYKEVFITGCKKTGDESTFYLNLFPDWKEDFITEVHVEGMDVISSTKIRDLFYKGETIPDVINKSIKDFLDKFRNENQSIIDALNKVN